MLWRRSALSLFITSCSGFVLCLALAGGCSLFGNDGETGGSSSSSAGSGGSGGAMASSSSSSGAPVECSDHTSLNEFNCSLIEQNCNPGEACVPNGSGTTCIYETGIKGVGASCTETKECAAGLFCVFYACAPVCCPSQSAAFCGSAQCNVNINLGQGNVWACNLAKACTLFGNDCPKNQQCRLGDPDQELSLCAPSSGTVSPEGGSCMFLNDCGANQICSLKDTCRYSCSLADWQSKAPGEGGCPPMQMCNPVSTNYGVCEP
jgi:hypothetical protein